MKQGKKYKDSAKLIDRTVQYDAAEAHALWLSRLLRQSSTRPSRFTSRLGVDSRHADQQVRGAVVLPNGTGKTRKVLVFAKDAQGRRCARGAALTMLAAWNMVEKIQKENWFDFDVVVATPDMMGIVGRLGKVLGPKGLMPSPKAGTVTPDVAKAISEIKAGKIEYRLDKTNIIHCPIGKVSFGAEKLAENFDTLIGAIIKAKPAAAKGQYIKSCVVGFHHGPRHQGQHCKVLINNPKNCA